MAVVLVAVDYQGDRVLEVMVVVLVDYHVVGADIVVPALLVSVVVLVVPPLVVVLV